MPSRAALLRAFVELMGKHFLSPRFGCHGEVNKRGNTSRIKLYVCALESRWKNTEAKMIQQRAKLNAKTRQLVKSYNTANMFECFGTCKSVVVCSKNLVAKSKIRKLLTMWRIGYFFLPAGVALTYDASRQRWVNVLLWQNYNTCSNTTRSKSGVITRGRKS